MKILADQGWKYSGKCSGCDFQVANTPMGEMIRFRVKSRLTINFKYLGYENLHIAFPVKQKNGTTDWYFTKHSDLVETARRYTNWLETKSWKLDGYYHTKSPSEKFLEKIRQYRLGNT
ncbi:MAG: hypothetical protein OXH65_05065 [Paracoccaceae bacterium]|nr:hypothetical protein [Paracoccaceae bacterium]